MAASALLVLASAASCGVHEWPDASAGDGMYGLDLVFDTDLPQWDQTEEGRASIVPDTRDRRESGFIRHIVRAYPIRNGAPLDIPSDEFIFTEDVAKGYDCFLTLRLNPGDYRLLVWSDLTESKTAAPYYQADDFSEITLAPGPHAGNTDYRDAFRGWTDITVEDYRTGGTHELPSVTVTMERPLAKFEFVTTDLADFLDKESKRLARESVIPRSGSLNDYRIVFYYTGFMPSAYSFNTDQPTNAETGVEFTSTLREFGNGEASLGFDYVFVRGDLESSVTVQIGIFDAVSGQRLSLSRSIRVPLQRSRHTVIRDAFLLMDSDGGIGIDPGYDDDFNITFPFLPY